MQHGSIDELIEPHLRAAIDALDGRSPLLAGMARYQMGWVDADLRPLPVGAVDMGKRMRPAVALLCCAAAGGDPVTAAPLAAALEILHNFTLVHDDIQDRSPTRRHRPTVWTIWGESQALNVGDAMFAASNIAMTSLRGPAMDAAVALHLMERFQRMAIEIVAGQVMDMNFEIRNDVTVDEYITMIAGKTSAIVEYAAWAGAIVGGATEATATQFEAFGLSLGLGFQIQDDLLGVWGATAQTGKAEADDIRRRKKSLPVLILRERVSAAERAELDDLYAADEINQRGITRVLDLLARHDVRAEVERHVRRHHDDALARLLDAAPLPTPARAVLIDRIESLANRVH